MQRAFIITLLALTGLTMSTAIAAGEKKETRLEPVVVTATRTETPEAEVASSVTVISSEDLEKRQTREVLEALREVPALDVVQSGGPGGSTSVFIRGAKSEHTLVLIDGIEINDPSQLGRSADLAHLTTANIERIEVVRGPQSVLYGSDAIGGVINIITKKGRKSQASIWGEGGSYGTYSFGGNASTASERLHFSFGGNYLYTDGISRATEEVPENTEDDRYLNSTISGRLGFTGPEKIVDLDVIYRYVDAEADIDDGTGRNPGNDDPNRVVTSTQTFLRTELGLRLFEGTWEQKLGLNLSDHRRQDQDGVDTRDTSESFYEFVGKSQKIDWQHNISLHEASTLTAGVEYEKEKFESRTLSGSTPQKSAAMRSYYVQDQVSLAEVFFLTAGARVDNHDRFGDETTWRIAPAVFITRTGTKIKGSYGTGFKAPSLYQLYDPTYGNPDLEAETSEGMDVGVEQYLFDDRLTLGVTYFYNDFQDLIEWVSTGPLTGTYRNIEEAESQGVECFIQVEPVEQVVVKANYTYTDTQDGTTGERLVRRPLHKASLSASYTVREGLNVTGTLVYVGERDDIYYPPWPEPSRTVVLDDYALVNLSGYYQATEYLRIYGRLENLLDEEYEEIYGYGTPGLAAYAGIKLMYR